MNQKYKSTTLKLHLEEADQVPAMGTNGAAVDELAATLQQNQLIKSLCAHSCRSVKPARRAQPVIKEHCS